MSKLLISNIGDDESMRLALAHTTQHFGSGSGTKRVARVVLIASVPPLMLKTPANPGGTPIEVFDGLCASMRLGRESEHKTTSWSKEQQSSTSGAWVW